MRAEQLYKKNAHSWMVMGRDPERREDVIETNQYLIQKEEQDKTSAYRKYDLKEIPDSMFSDDTNQRTLQMLIHGLHQDNIDQVLYLPQRDGDMMLIRKELRPIQLHYY